MPTTSRPSADASRGTSCARRRHPRPAPQDVEARPTRSSRRRRNRVLDLYAHPPAGLRACAPTSPGPLKSPATPRPGLTAEPSPGPPPGDPQAHGGGAPPARRVRPGDRPDVRPHPTDQDLAGRAGAPALPALPPHRAPSRDSTISARTTPRNSWGVAKHDIRARPPTRLRELAQPHRVPVHGAPSPGPRWHGPRQPRRAGPGDPRPPALAQPQRPPARPWRINAEVHRWLPSVAA